jgi:hypothetical protein
MPGAARCVVVCEPRTAARWPRPATAAALHSYDTAAPVAGSGQGRHWCKQGDANPHGLPHRDPTLPIWCAGRCSPGSTGLASRGGRNRVVPPRGRSSRGVVARPVSIRWSGSRLGTGRALRPPATGSVDHGPVSCYRASPNEVTSRSIVDPLRRKDFVCFVVSLHSMRLCSRNRRRQLPVATPDHTSPIPGRMDSVTTRPPPTHSQPPASPIPSLQPRTRAMCCGSTSVPRCSSIPGIGQGASRRRPRHLPSVIMHWQVKGKLHDHVGDHHKQQSVPLGAAGDLLAVPHTHQHPRQVRGGRCPTAPGSGAS